MAKNVMKMLKPSPTHGRNAFDMSARDVQSYNVGELLPVYCLETVPNDKVILKPADLIRALPLVTSPFMRMKQHLDFWFVPYNLLWSRWNEFIVDREEPNSAALKYRAFVPSANLKDMLTYIHSDDNTSSNVTVLGERFEKNAYRLLDSLGYPSDKGTSLSQNKRVNLFRLAAYQKIWYTEYRQQYYDPGMIGMVSPAPGLNENPALIFNFDDMPCDTLSNSDLFTVRANYGVMSPMAYMAQMRYRTWKKDLFTGLLPSTQFGAVSSVDVSAAALTVNSSSLPTDTIFGLVKNGSTGKLYSAASGSLGDSSTGNYQVSTLPSNFDILALRKSEAIQLWRERALRAGRFVEDNFEAHYGVKPQSHMDTHPTFIGSVSAPLNIGDVDVTASTGASINGAAGDIAGKALSSFSDKEFHFQTNDFGVIMGIFSILPEAEYESKGIDRPNQLLERFDFFTPEMENLGLEAVDYATMDANYASGAIGYAPRYWGYKTKVDKCHQDFFRSNGVFKQWCSPREQWAAATPNLKTLYVDYRTFNNNFVTTTVPQFLVDMYVDCTAIRPMSISGMPSY